MVGERDKDRTSLFHCTRSAVACCACWEMQTFEMAYTLCALSGPCPYWGATVRRHLLPLVPLGHAVFCVVVVLGPIGRVGTGYCYHWEREVMQSTTAIGGNFPTSRGSTLACFQGGFEGFTLSLLHSYP